MATSEIRNWASDLDEETRLQAERTNRLSIVTEPLALMPDAHYGIGSTVGSVIPTEGAIIPAAVGVDIGCGMCATKTDLTAGDLPDTMQPLVSQFELAIPSGVGKAHDQMRVSREAINWWADHPNAHANSLMGETAVMQLGTLGSGNHFAEVCLDQDDAVWMLLHSGSRGVGNKLATAHIKVARKMEQGLEDPDLGYFVQGEVEFAAYIVDMLWAQDYAWANRQMMMKAAIAEIAVYLGRMPSVLETVNCHHNYAVQETHYGRELWITRKGAISARKGQQGIIPGSMATGSFIVRGLGNPESYHSASHGAGRRMSRRQAKRELTVESLRERMAGKAWNHDRPEALLDEHPDAYKPIESVMQDQADLVQVEYHLRQILNYKGV